MTEPNTSVLLQQDDDHVRTLTLHRPHKRNAFDHALYHALADALDAASQEDHVRVVVLTGAGGAFSAGQDLSQMTDAANPDAPTPTGFPRLLDTLIGFDKPIIAAVDGVAVGLGFTILLHTDINYLSDTARLKAPFVSLGVAPEAASSFLLPHLVGPQRAAEIMLTARWVLAPEALSLGLAAEILPTSILMGAALKTAHAIAQHSPASVQHTRRLLRAHTLAPTRQALEREYQAFQTLLPSLLDAFLNKEGRP